MLVQPRHAVSMLLRAPEIPGAHPMESSDDEWAINRSAALDNFPDHGLKVYVPVWSAMGKGDKVELLFNGLVVDQHTLTQDTEIGERVTLWVAPKHWLTGPHTLAYRVTRFNQGPETFAPALKLYAKLEIPAGQDLDPEEGSHSNLFMFIDPVIVEGIIDKEIAKDGVSVIIRAESGTGAPYPDAAVGDVIVLSWGGVLVESAPLTAEQINDPDKHPIVIHIDLATILAAGDTDGDGLAVTFHVCDVVHNYSEDWCKATRLVVMTGTDLLDAPVVHEAVNNRLFLDELDGKDITVEVWAKKPAVQLGDIIALKMRGTTVDGEVVEITAPAQTIDNLPHTYKFILSNANVLRLAKTQVTFSYYVERPGTPDPLPSKGQFVTFIGEPKRLAAPCAEKAEHGGIDPDLPFPRVRIPFDLIMQMGMAIELIWFGTRPDKSTYTPELEWYFLSQEEIEAGKDFFITVDGKHLKTLEGGTLVLSYNLLSEGQNGEIVRRESLPAALLEVGEQLAELVRAIVLGEKNGMLETLELPHGASQATVLNPAVRPTKAGDKVFCTVTGEVSGEVELSIDITRISEGKDVHFTLNAKFVRDHFEPNRGKKVTVRYRIWRATEKEMSYSEVLEFVIGTALELKSPRVKEADDTRLEPLNSQTHLTAIVDYDGMQIGDQIIAIWTGADGTLPEGSHTTKVWAVATLGPQEIPLVTTVIAFNLSKEVKVFYQVSRGDNGPVKSTPLLLTVLPLQQQDLPRPEIDGMLGDVLDVQALVDSACTRIAKWPFIARGQKLWLRYFGTKADNSPYSSQTYEATPVPEAGLPNGLFPNAPVADLRGLKDGSKLEIKFKVTFDGSTDEDEAVIFSMRTYTVQAVPQEQVKFTNVPYTIAPGGRFKDIELQLRTVVDEKPVQGTFTLTIPPGFRYDDGESGPRDFVTNSEGMASISGVTGSDSSGTYTLIATKGAARDEASATVTAQGNQTVIPIGGGCWGVAISLDGTRVYVSGWSKNSISIIDTATHQIVETVLNIHSPHGIALHSNGQLCYVSNRYQDKVSFIDLLSGATLRTVATGQGPVGIVPSLDEQWLFVCNFSGASVTRINTGTYEVKHIPVGTSPRNGAASPDGKSIYISTFSTDIAVLDVETGIPRSIRLSGATWDVAFSPRGDFAYAVMASKIAVIDVKLEKVDRYIEKVGGWHITVGRTGEYLYVTNVDSDTLTRVNALTGAAGPIVKVGKKPRQAVSSTDAKSMYVCNYESDGLSRVPV
ncbi:YncE family protein [Pseudomonas sp. RT6P73]